MGTLYVFFECNGIEIASFADEKGGNHRIGGLGLPLFREESDAGFDNCSGEKPGNPANRKGFVTFFLFSLRICYPKCRRFSCF